MVRMSKIQNTICPICGYDARKEIGCEDICACCATHLGLQDELKYEELKNIFDDMEFIEYIFPDIKKYISKHEEYMLVDINIVRTLLRIKWVQNGCIFKYKKKWKRWNKEIAEQQLKNIDVDVKEILGILKSYHRKA